MSADIEWKNGFTAEVWAEKIGYRVVIRDEDGNLIREPKWTTEPENKADTWVKAYVEARDGDNNVDGDYADAVVRIKELEAALIEVINLSDKPVNAGWLHCDGCGYRADGMPHYSHCAIKRAQDLIDPLPEDETTAA